MKPIVIEDQTGADVETSFGALTDIQHMAGFVTFVDNVEMLTMGPVGVGTRWRETRTPVSRPVSHEMHMTAYDPPHRFAVETTAHGTLHRTTYELEPIDSGGTQVRVTFESIPLTAAAKLASPLGALFVAPTRHTLEKELKEMFAEAERRMLIIEAI